MKLQPLTILLIGFSIALIALSYAGFYHYVPNTTEAQYQKELGDRLQAEVDKEPLVRKRVERAQDLVARLSQQWQDIVLVKTPPANLARGGVNLAVNRWQLTVDARRFRNNAQRAVNAQMRYGGIKVINGPEVPMPSDNASNILSSYFNYPAFGFPVCVWNFGTVTVQGTLSQIERHIKGWSFMPNYLAVTDGLRLTGTAPLLTATYNLTVVAYIRAREIAAPVPEGGAAGATGGPGAGPGRGPTSMGVPKMSGG